MDWTTLTDLGIGVVAIILLYQTFMKFADIWQKSIDTQQEQTRALDRNAEAYEKLADVFDKNMARETAFQQEVLGVIKDTNRKVTEIHSGRIF